MKDLLMELSRAGGVGHQSEIQTEILRRLPAQAVVHTDALGGITAELGTEGPVILLAAHLDQVGFVVTRIQKDGFLQIAAVGSPDRRVLPGGLVTVNGRRPIPAVVCAVPPHLKGKGDADTFAAVSEIYLDTGLSLEEVSQVVRAGDPVSFALEPVALENGRYSGSAFDDRAGCAVLLKVAAYAAEHHLPCRLQLAFTAMEELGCHGAKITGFSQQPEEAVAVDVSFGDGPDIPSHQCGALGKGPMIGVAPVLDETIIQTLMETAKEENIPFQLEGIGSSTGTDADMLAVAGHGVRCGLVSIPLRNMHTPVEVVELSDLEQCAALLCAYLVKRGTQAC